MFCLIFGILAVNDLWWFVTELRGVAWLKVIAGSFSTIAICVLVLLWSSLFILYLSSDIIILRAYTWEGLYVLELIFDVMSTTNSSLDDRVNDYSETDSFTAFEHSLINNTADKASHHSNVMNNSITLIWVWSGQLNNVRLFLRWLFFSYDWILTRFICS